MQSIRFIRGSALMLLMALTVTACDEGTSPAADFDAQDAAETMENLTSAVETASLENAFGSVQNAGMLFGGSIALDEVAAYPWSLDASELEAEADLAAEVIPTDYHGNTYEWNPDSMRYVVADAAGAPTDGVRIIYYAIDPTTGIPATPLNALGYVDLRDLSTMESDRLGVTVFRYSDEVTLADYYIDLAFTYTQSSFDFNVASVGYLSNGTQQLNFDLSQDLSATETLITINQAYSLDLEGTDQAISFSATVTADPQSESEDPETMEAQAEISTGSRTVGLQVNYANGVLEGTVYDDGTAVVLIGGTLDEPTFTDTEGNELTEQQRAALSNMWDAIGEVFDFVENLFGFVMF
jgi:hypothetical protein